MSFGNGLYITMPRTTIKPELARWHTMANTEALPAHARHPSLPCRQSEGTTHAAVARTGPSTQRNTLLYPPSSLPPCLPPRSGLYPMTQHPFTPGVEGAGVVAALGRAVPPDSGLAPGTRVAYITRPPGGSYAQYTAVHYGRAVPLPQGVDCEAAAAAMIQAGGGGGDGRG